MQKDLYALLTDPGVFPVELTLTSGNKVRIDHLDYVHYSRKLRKIFFYPREADGGIVEMIYPGQIAKVRRKVKRAEA